MIFVCSTLGYLYTLSCACMIHETMRWMIMNRTTKAERGLKRKKTASLRVSSSWDTTTANRSQPKSRGIPTHLMST